jgi:hypothetical protein
MDVGKYHITQSLIVDASGDQLSEPIDLRFLEKTIGRCTQLHVDNLNDSTFAGLLNKLDIGFGSL